MSQPRKPKTGGSAILVAAVLSIILLGGFDPDTDSLPKVSTPTAISASLLIPACVHQRDCR